MNLQRRNLQDTHLKSSLTLINECYAQMERAQTIPQHYFRDYIALYIQNNSSQEFFSALCEHGIIERFFGHSSRHLASIAILQMFNLLLANTRQVNSLVYIFSQPCVHQYLFCKFNIFKQTSEAVEYYIQLLKTIIMKMTVESNNCLIKLFCNNRYPSFPLLTMVTLLGSSLIKETLVKVTAYQCVLILIRILNEKQVGRAYLNDMQIVVFYFEVGKQLAEGQEDREGMLKYVVDLIYTLRNNSNSLSLLLNTLTNLMIIKHANDIAKTILFLREISELIEDYKHFSAQTSHQILSIFATIVNKLYFFPLIYSTYLTSVKIVSNLRHQLQPNLIKYFHQRGEALSAQIQEFELQPEMSFHENIDIFDDWKAINESYGTTRNKNDKKQKGGFLGLFMNKMELCEEYIKTAVTMAGLNFHQVSLSFNKLPECLNFQTALYITELFIRRNLQSENKLNSHIELQSLDIHHNEYYGNLDVWPDFFIQVFGMLDKLQAYGLSLLDSAKDSMKGHRGISFYHSFLLNLRSYISRSLCSHLSLLDGSIAQTSLWSQLLYRLELQGHLQKKCEREILFKMEKLQQQIHELIFQNDFRDLIQYVMRNKEARYLSQFYWPQFPKGQIQSTMEKTFRERVSTIMVQYEFLRRIMDSSLKSIHQFVSEKWAEIILVEKESPKYQFVHRDHQDNEIKIYVTENGVFKLQNLGSDGTLIDFSFSETDGQIDETKDNQLYFVQSYDPIVMKNRQQASNLRNDLRRMSSYKQQIITKQILMYFEETHQQLCRKVYGEQQEGRGRLK